MKSNRASHLEGKRQDATSHVLRKSPERSQSQMLTVVTNGQHAPMSTAVDHKNGASPYTNLTLQSLQQHDFPQASSRHNVDFRYRQVEQAKRLQANLDTLERPRDPSIHTHIHREAIRMLPMERFQASAARLEQLNVAYGEMLLLNSTILAQTPSKDYTYSVPSAVVVNTDVETMDGYLYGPNNAATSRDGGAFAPNCHYGVQTSADAHHVEDLTHDLAGIGAHFESHPNLDYTTSPCVNDDACLEE